MTSVKCANGADVEGGNVVSAKSCISMQETQDAIDIVDRELVTLLARRQTYIERAASLRNRREHVRNLLRIEDIMSRVLLTSRKTGLSPRIARSVWLVLIEVSIAHEEALFGKASFEAVDV